MADFPFGAVGGILGSGLDFLSSALGRGQQNSQFQQSALQAQQALQFQMDAAKQGITWRVQDAKNAGVSPLVALGAPTFNPSPALLSSGGVPGSSTNFGGALGAAGQDISRAVGATQTAAEKQAIAFQTARLANETKIADANVNMLNSQAAVNNARLMSTPAFPSPVGSNFIPGQGNSPVQNTAVGKYEANAPKVDNANPTSPTTTAGPAAPYNTFFRSGDGLVAEPSKNSKAEDEFLAPLMSEWYWRNKVVPNFGAKDQAPPLSVVQREFPGATGVYWSTVNWKWMPSYLEGGRAPYLWENNSRRVK